MAEPTLTVILDPGHGGDEPGSIGASGTPEKVYNLDTALRLAALLEQSGINVVLTRRDDRTVGLSERLSLAPSGDLWLSIHHNSSPAHDATGTETLIQPQKAAEYRGVLPPPEHFAREVQNRVVRAIRTVNRGVRYRSDLYLLNRLSIPAVLVEVCFIDNPEDEQKVITAEGRQRVAYGLAGAIGAYTGVRVAQPIPWGTIAGIAIAVGAGYYAWRVAIPRLRERGGPGILPGPSPGPASA